MSKTNRAVVVYGNDTHLNIQMHKFDKTSGEYIDFDLTQVTDLNVFLICSKHATEIHLDYTINSQFTNIITCDIDYRLLHPNASYGIVVEGYDGQDHFRYEALPSEGFLVISNTSGLKVTDEVNTIDLSARTGWGISVDGADLTNYYTKDEVDALLENIDLEDYYDKTETDDLLDDKQDTLVSGTNIKTINNQSILGAGNITIESPQQIQSDWNQTDTTKADYIKNKPNLSTYAQKSDLNNYYTKTQADTLLNAKVDNSELDNYYDKTETDTMLNQKANTTDLNNYQETLVSGANIKTINNESILGSGNITIQGGGGEQVQANWEETDTTDPSYIQNKPDLSQYATQTELALKQDTLVSGQNIKTVNNQSLLGSGNIDIQVGDNHDSADEATANALYELNERAMFTNTMLDQLSDSVDSLDASMQQMENDVDSALAQSEAKVNASLSEADDEFQSAAFALNTLNTVKQDKLVSGTNIKTINNESVLGAGNLTITQVQADWSETGTSSPSYIQNKPTISTPGFIQYTNPNSSTKIGLINSISTNYNTNIGKGAVIEGTKDSDTSAKIEASGAFSHAEGGSTKASAQYSHAEGYVTTSSNYYAHAEGLSTTASGMATHAEGQGSQATNEEAHAEGYFTTASGKHSHTEGYFTTASGLSSHAEGQSTTASGSYSHAEGYSTTAQNSNEHAAGKFNNSVKANTTFGDSGNTLFSVGNGSSTNTKHNAIELRQNGDLYIADTNNITYSNYYEKPMLKIQDVMVTSSTTGLKIEVVATLPASPDSNTIYIVQ